MFRSRHWLIAFGLAVGALALPWVMCRGGRTEPFAPSTSTGLRDGESVLDSLFHIDSATFLARLEEHRAVASARFGLDTRQCRFEDLVRIEVEVMANTGSGLAMLDPGECGTALVILVGDILCNELPGHWSELEQNGRKAPMIVPADGRWGLEPWSALLYQFKEGAREVPLSSMVYSGMMMELSEARRLELGDLVLKTWPR